MSTEILLQNFDDLILCEKNFQSNYTCKQGAKCTGVIKYWDIDGLFIVLDPTVDFSDLNGTLELEIKHTVCEENEKTFKKPKCRKIFIKGRKRKYVEVVKTENLYLGEFSSTLGRISLYVIFTSKARKPMYEISKAFNKAVRNFCDNPNILSDPNGIVSAKSIRTSDKKQVSVVKGTILSGQVINTLLKHISRQFKTSNIKHKFYFEKIGGKTNKAYTKNDDIQSELVSVFGKELLKQAQIDVCCSLQPCSEHKPNTVVWAQINSEQFKFPKALKYNFLGCKMAAQYNGYMFRLTSDRKKIIPNATFPRILKINIYNTILGDLFDYIVKGNKFPCLSLSYLKNNICNVNRKLSWVHNMANKMHAAFEKFKENPVTVCKIHTYRIEIRTKYKNFNNACEYITDISNQPLVYMNKDSVHTAINELCGNIMHNDTQSRPERALAVFKKLVVNEMLVLNLALRGSKNLFVLPPRCRSVLSKSMELEAILTQAELRGLRKAISLTDEEAVTCMRNLSLYENKKISGIEKGFLVEMSIVQNQPADHWAQQFLKYYKKDLAQKIRRTEKGELMKVLSGHDQGQYRTKKANKTYSYILFWTDLLNFLIKEESRTLSTQCLKFALTVHNITIESIATALSETLQERGIKFFPDQRTKSLVRLRKCVSKTNYDMLFRQINNSFTNRYSGVFPKRFKWTRDRTAHLLSAQNWAKVHEDNMGLAEDVRLGFAFVLRKEQLQERLKVRPNKSFGDAEDLVRIRPFKALATIEEIILHYETFFGRKYSFTNDEIELLRKCLDYFDDDSDELEAEMIFAEDHNMIDFNGLFNDQANTTYMFNTDRAALINLNTQIQTDYMNNEDIIFGRIDVNAQIDNLDIEQTQLENSDYLVEPVIFRSTENQLEHTNTFEAQDSYTNIDSVIPVQTFESVNIINNNQEEIRASINSFLSRNGFRARDVIYFKHVLLEPEALFTSEEVDKMRNDKTVNVNINEDKVIDDENMEDSIQKAENEVSIYDAALFERLKAKFKETTFSFWKAFSKIYSGNMRAKNPALKEDLRRKFEALVRLGMLEEFEEGRCIKYRCIA